MSREYGKQLKSLTKTYGLSACKSGSGHYRLESESLGFVVYCSSTPSDRNAIHCVERDIIRAFRNAGYHTDGTRLTADNDNVKTYGNPFPDVKKTLPQERRERKPAALLAMINSTGPAGTFAAMEQHCE